MKKLFTIVAMFLCLLGIATVAQASWVDLGSDDMGEKWYAEYRESQVSRNGVPYHVIAIEITLTPAGRTFWGVPDNAHYLGLLRVLDCRSGRFATIQEAHYGSDGRAFYKSEIANEWTWTVIDTTRETMMGRVKAKFCGLRTR